jgi:hypothetical protein
MAPPSATVPREFDGPVQPVDFKMPSLEFIKEANTKIDALASKQSLWGNTRTSEKIKILGEILVQLDKAREDFPKVADDCNRVQGFVGDTKNKGADMDWLIEQITMADFLSVFVRRFQGVLKTFEKTGKCPPPPKLTQREDGQWVADVFPFDGSDQMKPHKTWSTQIWVLKGKEPTQGASLFQAPRTDSVALVLGAGNLGALAWIDAIHLLFQCNTVTLLKLHNLRFYQEDITRKVFEPLIKRGFFEVIREKNGLADAQYLVRHEKLCQIHMTGSTETHDAIVWGPREAREQRKRQNNPAIDLSKVKVTSELGCVTPYIIAPAKFSKKEMQHHAKHLAITMGANNGYYCNSPKLLFMAEGWPQREEFLDELRGILMHLPNKHPYYPGTHTRFNRFVEAYAPDKVETIEVGVDEPSIYGPRIPWTLIHTAADPANLDASKNEYAFRNEPFCPILTVCTIKGVSEAPEFLQTVPTLCNNYVWGRLSCSLIVHPEIQASVGDAVEDAIAELQYGQVFLNGWSGGGYHIAESLWGGYAGGDPALENIHKVESGIGFVQNALMFDHPEKAVVRSPFIDEQNHFGCSPPLVRDQAAPLVNLLINPGLGSLFKFLGTTLKVEFKKKFKSIPLCCCGEV